MWKWQQPRPVLDLPLPLCLLACRREMLSQPCTKNELWPRHFGWHPSGFKLESTDPQKLLETRTMVLDASAPVPQVPFLIAPWKTEARSWRTLQKCRKGTWYNIILLELSSLLMWRVSLLKLSPVAGQGNYSLQLLDNL